MNVPTVYLLMERSLSHYVTFTSVTYTGVLHIPALHIRAIQSKRQLRNITLHIPACYICRLLHIATGLLHVRALHIRLLHIRACYLPFIMSRICNARICCASDRPGWI